MIRSGLLFLLWFVSGHCFPHSDPGFLFGRNTFRSLLPESPAATFCNPAFLTGPGRLHWLAGITNHHGIRSYNTLLMGAGIVAERRSYSLVVKHSALPEAEYRRTYINLGVNLQATSFLYIGAAVRCVQYRLPAHYGSLIHVGGMTGAYYDGSLGLSAGVAAGYYQAVGHDVKGVAGFTHLVALVGYRTAPKAGLVISMEMVSSHRALVLAAYHAEVNPRIRIMAGVGTGSEQVFAGILFDAGKLRPLVISGFNPVTGSTNTLLVTGRSL